MKIFFFSCLKLSRQFDWKAYFQTENLQNGNESLTEEYDTKASEVSTSASLIISNSESTQSCGSYLNNKEISTVGDGTNANSEHYLTDAELANILKSVADVLHDYDPCDIHMKLEDKNEDSSLLIGFLHSDTDKTRAKPDEDIQLNLGNTSNSLNGPVSWYTEDNSNEQFNYSNLSSDLACLFSNN